MMPASADRQAPAQALPETDALRSLLQQRLVAPALPDTRIREIHAGNVRRRDGSRGTAQYELVLEDIATGRVWRQGISSVVFGGDRTSRVWQTLRPAVVAQAAAATAPELAPFAYLPELDMLIQVFPHDHRLPGLARLMSELPNEISSALLTQFGPGDWQLAGATAEVVQYRVDMRATLRLDLRAFEATTGQSDRRSCYAKVYRDGDMARRSDAIHRQLAERLAAEPRLAVPHPAAFSEPLRTVFTANAPGTPLAKIIRRGEGFESSLQAAARAVAMFHQLDIVAPPRPFAADVARLREAEASLTAGRPELSAEVAEIVATVIAGLEDAPVGLIHGDLKPEHLLVDGERVTLIDFDLSGLADPVADIAHLLAFLGRAEERSRAADTQAAQIFLDEYFRNAPESWRPRLALYHAMSSIHKAVGLSRRRGAAGRDAVAAIIGEGSAFLSGESAGTSSPTFKRRMTRASTR